MSTPANSVNEATTGIAGFTGTSFTATPATEYNVLVGGSTTSTLTNVAPNTAGFVLTSNGLTANPSFEAIPATGGYTWIDVTSGTQTISSGNGYITDFATQVTYTLPATPAQGDVFRITGGETASATAPWILAQNALQKIRFGTQTTTTGTGGSLTSTLQFDNVELVCTVGGASAVWTVISSTGNIIVT